LIFLSQLQVFESGPGDAYFISSGTLHAIGEGNLLLEIQQNSDTTYRVSDWGRVDENGKPRELHVDKALESINYINRTSPRIPGVVGEVQHNRKFPVVNRCRFFSVDDLRLIGEWNENTSASGSFHLISCINKSIRISTDEDNIDLNPGQTREKAQFVEFSRNDEGNWVDLHIQSYNNMLSIHNWFKTLCSFFGEKTGFDTQRIINEYEIALNTSITTTQKRYLLIFSKIFSAFNYDSSTLEFINQSPVYRLNPVKYIWELRKDAGLDYNPKDVKQKLFYSELKNTFNSIDDLTNTEKTDSSSSNAKSNQ